MICSSVHLPIPVAGSGVMLDEYTVPNGPSYLRAPELSGSLGAVWHAQPAAAPKMYLPRATGSGSWPAAAEAVGRSAISVGAAPPLRRTRWPRGVGGSGTGHISRRAFKLAMRCAGSRPPKISQGAWRLVKGYPA